MIIGIVIGLLLVFILPGLGITSLFFPPASLSVGKRLLFSVGASLAVTALAGLALNAASVLLQATAWVIVLGIVALVTAAIALIIHRPSFRGITAPSAKWLNLRDAGLFGLAGAMVVAACLLARTPAPPQGLQGYSLLYLVPAQNGNSKDLRLGVISDEFTTMNYKLQVELNGSVVHEWEQITLEPGQRWEATLIPPANAEPAARLEALLFQLDKPGVIYRHASILVTAAAGQN